MRRRRPGRGGVIAAGAVVALMALGAVLASGRGTPEPMRPETLDRISAKNREAAVVAAARMKADSKEAARAADARAAAPGAGKGEDR